MVLDFGSQLLALTRVVLGHKIVALKLLTLRMGLCSAQDLWFGKFCYEIGALVRL
jgi:hypothetical protein